MVTVFIKIYKPFLELKALLLFSSMFLHLLASTSLFSWPLGIVTYDNVSFEEDGLNVALETCVDADPFLKSSVVYDEDCVKKLPSLETKSGVETGLLKNLEEHNKREITQISN